MRNRRPEAKNFLPHYPTQSSYHAFTNDPEGRDRFDLGKVAIQNRAFEMRRSQIPDHTEGEIFPEVEENLPDLRNRAVSHAELLCFLLESRPMQTRSNQALRISNAIPGNYSSLGLTPDLRGSRMMLIPPFFLSGH
jgi:hypothetical protein